MGSAVFKTVWGVLQKRPRWVRLPSTPVPRRLSNPRPSIERTDGESGGVAETPQAAQIAICLGSVILGLSGAVHLEASCLESCYASPHMHPPECTHGC